MRGTIVSPQLLLLCDFDPKNIIILNLVILNFLFVFIEKNSVQLFVLTIIFALIE